MIGEHENNRCYFCRGRLENKLATVPFVVQDAVIVIKQVPAEVCGQCGEAIVSSPVARHIDALLKQVYRLRSEVSVITYSDSALQLA